MKQTAFLGCFPTQGKSSSGLNNSENDSTGIIDSRPGCGRPHTARSIAKISDVEDFALILLIGVFKLIKSSPSVKNILILKQSFCYTFYSLGTV